MQRHGIDPAQAKNYVTNNRHNHVTAFYYLLKKKAEREPSILEEPLPQQPPPPPPPQQQQQQPQQEKRSDSPLIFRPEPKKEYYIPKKTVESKETSRKDDSFNASNIVSSLLEANKSKYVSSLPNRLIKKQDPASFKLEEFKLFPKKKNSSIYEQSTSNSKSAMTSRSDTEENLTASLHPPPAITPNSTIPNPRASMGPSEIGGKEE